MNPKSVYAVYFSATGTTEKVVSAIAEDLSEKYGIPLNTVDFTLPDARKQHYDIPSDAVAVFGVPVYAGRIPNLLLPFVKSGFSVHDTPAVPVVLYGNRNYDDALIELRDVLEQNNFRTVSAGAFVGEHSFSTTLGAGRPDGQDMEFVHKLADMTAERLENNFEGTVSVKGNEPIRPYYTPRDLAGNHINILKVKPKTSSDKCIKCGLCAKVCPMGSINSENPAEVNGICIKCCACVKKCPVGAKYYDDDGYLYHKTELEQGFSRRAEPELF